MAKGGENGAVINSRIVFVKNSARLTGLSASETAKARMAVRSVFCHTSHSKQESVMWSMNKKLIRGEWIKRRYTIN
jgi:hypothetical protein